MLADLGFEDLAQHAVHRSRRTAGGRGRGRCGCKRRRGRGGRRTGDVEGFLAGRDAIGDVLHARHIGMDAAVAAQGGIELRQHLVGLAHQRDHRRAGRAAAIEHAVEHALDLPAELAQHARADQPAAALERMEHAPHGAQALHALGRGAPCRQQPAQVLQLLVELLDEHIADVLVDLLGIIVEPAVHAFAGLHGRCHRRVHDGGRGHAGLDGERIERGSSLVQLGQERRDLMVGCGGFVAAIGCGRVRHGLGGRLVAAEIERSCIKGQRCDGFLRHGIACVDAEECRGTGIGRARIAGGPGGERLQRQAGIGREIQRGDVEVRLGVGGHAFGSDRIEGTEAVGRIPRRQCGRLGGRCRRNRRRRRMDGVAEHQRRGCRRRGWRGCLDRRLRRFERCRGGDDRGCRLRCFAGGVHGERRGCILVPACSGYRPVAQRLQAAAGDVEDLLATGAPLAQRFQVVLEAGHGIGQRVQLAPAGDALAPDQLHADVLADAVHVVRRYPQVEHAQRAGHLVKQARHVLQACMVPIRLDEGDEGLARGGEVGNGLVGQHLDRAPGLQRGRILVALQGGAEISDLVVQRGIDVEQRPGDVQQQVVVDGTAAIDHLAQRVALLRDHAAGHAQPHHAQRVGYRAQLVDLGLQVGGGPAHAHVQVQRVLDAQQFFLDRIADRIQQLAVAPLQAAARMLQFGLAGLARFRIERQQHTFVDAFGGTRGADLVEQRQQHDRNVAVAVLQAFEVIGQQHGAAHQGGAGLVAVRHGAIAHGVGQQLQFLGHHRRGIQLDHPQRALHLVQVAGTEAHAAGVGRIFDEVFDLAARLAQGLVQLRLDPAQRRVAHRIAQGIHRALPCSMVRLPSGRPCCAV